MVKGELEVLIDNEAKLQLRELYIYIQKDSIKYAKEVSKGILSSIKELIKNPEKHTIDKYRLNNDGSYRAYELYRYRITYHVSQNQVTVIRIRHTKMNPLEY